MLLDARYEDTGEGMNEKQLLDETLILFVAGHETSANALTWTWYLLSQHPEAVVKIRREIVEKIGDRPPEFADLPKLEYLTQVIEESMRLFPPAWITDRVAVDDDQYNGIDIPKGIAVVTYIYGAHHSPDYWPEPEKFIPERFSKENKKKQAPFSYLPFGGGPRLCIGNNFAMMEMQLALARLVPRYDFQLAEGQSIELQPLITLRPKNGIMMKFDLR
jgi:cytochrome P450